MRKRAKAGTRKRDVLEVMGEFQGTQQTTPTEANPPHHSHNPFLFHL